MGTRGGEAGDAVALRQALETLRDAALPPWPEGPTGDVLRVVYDVASHALARADEKSLPLAASIRRNP